MISYGLNNDKIMNLDNYKSGILKHSRQKKDINGSFFVSREKLQVELPAAKVTSTDRSKPTLTLKNTKSTVPASIVKHWFDK